LRPSRTAFIDEDQPMVARQRQQIRKKIVMRRSRSSMHNQQRLAPSQRNVVNHHAIGVDEAILQRIDVSNRCGGMMNCVSVCPSTGMAPQSSRTAMQTHAIDNIEERIRVSSCPPCNLHDGQGNGPRKIRSGWKRKKP